MVARLRRHKTAEIALIEGQTGIPGNERADVLAARQKRN
jgi:ribonuclease HI